MSTQRTYLAWFRRGLPALIAAPDAPGATLPARGGAQLEIWINDEAGRDQARRAQMDVALFGPGDVAALDPDCIAHTDPPPDSTGFEPNYFPYIEFKDPDMPWIFTPASPHEERLRPWICLVVIPQSSATLGRSPGSKLAEVQAPASELPDLAESWAWAHTQVLRSDGSLELADTLRLYPGDATSRLLCPRRLQPATSYLACVVPAFESGRKSGLGEPLTAANDSLAPAWTRNSGQTVRLPVYYNWRFTTGEGEDFEALARRIRPSVLPAEAGTSAIDISNPGWTMPVSDPKDPQALVPMEGVLRNPSASPGIWAPAVRASFEARLQTVLNAGAVAPGNVPVVVPPVYGSAIARHQTVGPAGQTPQWLRELNLDPVMRAAAGAAADVIRFEQETLMAEAWRQLSASAVTGAAEHSRSQLAAAVRETLGSRFEDTPLASSPASAALLKFARAGGPVEKGAAAEASAITSVAPEQVLEVPDRMRFAPRFLTSAYEGMRVYFPDLMMPGLSSTSANSISVLQYNPQFVEAWLVGLNHEMGRELLWRSYPVDPRATFFRNFWSVGTGDDASAEIDPISTWKAESALGTHLRPGASPGLLLLLRADLLRRFPRVRIFAAEAVRGPDGRRQPGSNHIQAQFRARWGEDAFIFGFSLKLAEASGQAGGHPGWFFVIEEDPVAARFGLDYDGNPPRAVTDIGAWNTLRWEDLADASRPQPPYIELTSRLTGIGKPLPVRAGEAGSPSAMWGRHAADMAAITEQTPFRIAVHASLWLKAS